MSWWKRVIDRVERAAMASAYAQVGAMDLAREVLAGRFEDEPEDGGES